MSNDEIQIIGKKVKDMYGTPVGKVVGTISDIDGSIQTVGVDCGADGLKQIQFEQLVVQTDVVIFIPKWRLDSQRLLREKGLTLRRLKALIELVSENDDMKESAEMLNEKYKSKLSILDETENKIHAQLDARSAELDEQLRSVKMLIFDAKMQYKSNEISESTFESVKTQTTDLIEHITHEQAEISNVQRRLQDLSMEVQTTETPRQQLQEEESYLNTQSESEVQTKLPEVPEEAPEIQIPNHSKPISAPIITPVQQASSNSNASDANAGKKTAESDWLARMEAQ
ncbi:MAG TPA: CdvA-like protein [Nitrosopumilaceae archaeon]|nr:CdvA-like protein [Nitrosopumilaceae archaeon]